MAIIVLGGYIILHIIFIISKILLTLKRRITDAYYIPVDNILRKIFQKEL